MDSAALYDFIRTLLLPPASLIVLLGVGLVFPRRFGRLSWIAATLLYLLSCPLVAAALLRSLEPYPALTLAGLTPDTADAIVILSGDVDDTHELGSAALGPLTIARLRLGVHLQKATGLPVLVTGGRFGQATVSVAEEMQRALRTEYGVDQILVENKARDTWENATLSADILLPLGKRRIYLVTHSWHMPRARLAFVRAGLTVIPAPTEPTTWPSDVAALLPSAKGMLSSYYALHEIVGYFLYDIMARLEGARA